MGQTQTVFLPPWVPSTEAEKACEHEFREAIMKLSATAANLIAPHPLHADAEFCFDWVEHRPFAEAAYTGDRRLHRLLPRLVPKHISEEAFWRNYFCASSALHPSVLRVPASATLPSVLRVSPRVASGPPAHAWPGPIESRPRSTRLRRQAPVRAHGTR